MADYNRQPNNRLDRRLTDFDDKKRSLELWRMNLVPPETGIFDAPKRCYELNDEWARIVMGIVSWLADTPVWRDAENEGYSAIEQILEFMIGQPCMTFELRQSPDDNCILEQSLDGGTTWTTAMDYSTCLPVPDYTEVNDFYDDANQQIIDNNLLYDGTIPSIFPNGVYDLTPTQANTDRDLALCASLIQVVDMACEITIEWKQQQGILLGGIAFITGAIVHVLLVAGVIVTGGSGLPLAVAISGYIVGAVTALLTDYSVDVLSDQNARQLVACCMLDALEGQTLSKTNFENSLDNCNFTFGTNEAQIAGLIEVILDEDGDDSMFAQFLAFNAELYETAQVGALPDCPCDIGWNHVFDFTTTSYSAMVTNYNNTYPVNWVDGDGWHGGKDAGGARDGMYFTFPASAQLTKAEVVENLTLTASNTRWSGIEIYNSIDVKIGVSAEVPANSGAKSYTVEDNLPDSTYVRVYTGSRDGTSKEIVVRLEFWGTGVNPFI